TCIPIKNLNVKPTASLAFTWDDLKPNQLNNWNPELLVYGYTVLNMSTYFDNIPNYNDGIVPDSALSFVNNKLFEVLYTNQTSGKPRSKDISWLVSYNNKFQDAISCILSRYQAGVVFTQTTGFTFSKKLIEVSDSGEMLGDPLYTIILVTAYSEDKNSLQTTLDSLVKTDYSDDHKLFFIVADGMIK
ncbi:18567_t:CDS:2, partial [Racocetra persica]